MADIVATAVVSDGSDALALTVSRANGYRITRTGLGTGLGAMRRITAQSPWVRGRTLVAAVEDVVTDTLEVRVQGASQVDYEAKKAALVNAFRQDSYTVTVTVEGVSEVWANCEPADVSVGGQGGALDPFELRHFQQVVTMQVPHDPVSL